MVFFYQNLSGNTAGKMQDGLFQYDPSAMSWTKLSAAGFNAPVDRIGPGFASAIGRIFVFGGSSGAGKNVLFAGLWVKVSLQITYASKNTLQSILICFVPFAGGGILDDLWTIEAPRALQWQAQDGGREGNFIDTYDWDAVILDAARTNFLYEPIVLCSGFYPCILSLWSNGSGMLKVDGKGSLACLASTGCLELSFNSLSFVCVANETVAATTIIQGTTLEINGVSFEGCASTSDGGAVQCSGAGSTVKVHSTRFSSLRSGGLGGAISAVGCSVNVSNSSFINCSAVEGGGAISASQYVCYDSNSSQTLQSSIYITQCQFDACYSIGSGGALVVTSVSGLATVIDSHFINCQSQVWGGAIHAAESAQIEVLNSSFEFNVAKSSGGGLSVSGSAKARVFTSSFHGNIAFGDGGGALFATDAELYLEEVTCTENLALSGGGGMVYWSGPVQPTIVNSVPYGRLFCGVGNIAAYGNCFATPYSRLVLQGWSDIIYPGLLFQVQITKQDAYNQTISSDTSSIVQVIPGQLQADSVISVLGTYFAVLESGVATFSIALKPSFIDVGVGEVDGSIVLKTQPVIYAKGLDFQTGANMISKLAYFTIPLGSSVCPKGYVLALDQTDEDSNKTVRQGICSLCVSGTYSLDPLVGYVALEPTCLNCPAGGTCTGGCSVEFAVGNWEISKGKYVLMSCPIGYQLVNSIGGTFSHDAQRCAPCPIESYIYDSNNSKLSCQPCPIGAVCNGGLLKGLVEGSVWVGNEQTGLYTLSSCPEGYEMETATQYGQQCLICPSSSFCEGGTAAAIPCPQGTFSTPGSNSSEACKPVVFVAVDISLPLSLADFESNQDKVVRALSAAAGVAIGNVVITSFSGVGRRFNPGSKQEHVSSECEEARWLPEIRRLVLGSSCHIQTRPFSLLSSTPSTMIFSNIATPDISTATRIIESLNQNSLNTALYLQGLPNSNYMTLSIMEQNIQSSQSYQQIVIGCIVGFSALSICLTLAWYGLLKRKQRVTKDVKILMIMIEDIRTKFRITQKDGYLLETERHGCWNRRNSSIVILQNHIVAAARLALLQDFDVTHFNSFCYFIEGNVCSGYQDESRYAVLRSFLLGISKELIRPDIPKYDKDFYSTTYCQEPLDAVSRYHLFFQYLMKCRIWSEDTDLYENLKQVAREFMDEISDHCEIRYLEISNESRGQELISYHIPLAQNTVSRQDHETVSNIFLELRIIL